MRVALYKNDYYLIAEINNNLLVCRAFTSDSISFIKLDKELVLNSSDERLNEIKGCRYVLCKDGSDNEIIEAYLEFLSEKQEDERNYKDIDWNDIENQIHNLNIVSKSVEKMSAKESAKKAAFAKFVELAKERGL